MGPSFGFGLFSTIFPIVFAVFFLLIVGVIIFAIAKQVRLSSINRAAPEVSAIASVVDKHIDTRGGNDMPVTQHHFVSFEQPSGERFELEVPAGEYGLLVVGDRGSVTMKGTQYRGFAREIMR